MAGGRNRILIYLVAKPGAALCLGMWNYRSGCAARRWRNAFNFGSKVVGGDRSHRRVLVPGWSGGRPGDAATSTRTSYAKYP